MDELGLFVKRPVAGSVKTRLAETLGGEFAAELYRAFTHDLVERLRTIGDRRTLCFAPDEAAARDHFATLGGEDFTLWPQPSTSLGDRLRSYVDAAFGAGAERLVVIGSDSPLLPRSFVERAFAELETHDVVLGPATDGGYYLVGLARPVPGLFDGIAWSGPRVLGQTVARLADTNDVGLALLPPWYDVDTLEDLLALRGHVAALRAAGEPVDLTMLEPLLADPAIDSAADLYFPTTRTQTASTSSSERP